jgi:hypothetical protein
MAEVSLHPIVEAIDDVIDAVKVMDIDEAARAVALGQLYDVRSQTILLCTDSPARSYTMHVGTESQE